MIKLRPYQKEVTPAVVKFFHDNKGEHPVVALPTGSGKTYCIADLIRYCVDHWGVKVIVLSHVKEILEQNHKALSAYLDCEIGVNSSMMGRREVKDITIAGIQSVYRNPEIFKDFNLVIVDEAHLIYVDQESMYQKFFKGIGKHICVGFTATPYRLGTGYIYGDGPNSMFDGIAYDCTSTRKFNKLVKDGYLAKLTTKRTKYEMDTTGIRLIGGDFNEKQMADKFNRENVTNSILKEVLAAGVDRRKWMVFAIDMKHAEHIAEILIRSGIPTAVVHSDMKKIGFDRDETIEKIKLGAYRCVVNVNILTTGFDDPTVDLIAVLRPTKSPVLHVQMLGRGSRPSPGKKDCLVLDFARNIDINGPINDVTLRINGKGAIGGEPIVKTCPDCQEKLPPAVRKCPECGYKFEFQHGLETTASEEAIINDGKDHWLRVDRVEYELNDKPSTPNSVKVTYICGKKKIREWICVEHKGYAKHKADHWVKYRGGRQCNRAEELLEQMEDLKTPTRILIQKKGNYYLVKDSSF